MIPPDQSDRDAEEPGSSRKSIFIVVLVAEDVVDSTKPGDRSGKCQCAKPNSTDVDAAVFRGIGLQSYSSQLVSTASAKQDEPDSSRGKQSDEYREIRGGAVKRGNELIKSR